MHSGSRDGPTAAQPEATHDARARRVRVVDSHTAGEPTRVVVSGGPQLGRGPMAERLARLRREHDVWRAALVTEPRGSDVLVGALLCAPVDPAATAGVLFFNNVGYLGMCGHGVIGVIETLRHLGRIGPGRHTLETPVGPVVAELHGDGRVSVENVPAYRYRADVRVDVPGYGSVRGDVAWGGNWFFLTHADPARTPIDARHLDALTEHAWAVREALAAANVTGEGGAEIDHVELFAPSDTADSRSFVLCPGRAFDRSPCGTGTSAKLACLAAEGRLEPGRVWRQESVIGSAFEASYRPGADGRVHPTITGRAFVTAEATLLMHPHDPFRFGIFGAGGGPATDGEAGASPRAAGANTALRGPDRDGTPGRPAGDATPRGPADGGTPRAAGAARPGATPRGTRRP